jgi:hypothetical protein
VVDAVFEQIEASRSNREAEVLAARARREQVATQQVAVTSRASARSDCSALAKANDKYIAALKRNAHIEWRAFKLARGWDEYYNADTSVEVIERYYDHKSARKRVLQYKGWVLDDEGQLEAAERLRAVELKECQTNDQASSM